MGFLPITHYPLLITELNIAEDRQAVKDSSELRVLGSE